MAKNSNSQQAPAQGAPQVPETMQLWERWRHVGPGMLKRINGGNLNGKSDINPLWRFQALTEAFGPCGFGWTVKEVARWTDTAAGETAASVKVELRVKLGDTWSEPIEGVGGSKLCGKGKGDGINDEAWKMATTDAISVACKSLGMAADVYCGRQSHQDQDQQPGQGREWPDYGTKYENRRNGQFSPQSQQPGNYTGQGVRGQNSPVSGQNGDNYGPGPVYAGSGQPYQAPPAGDPGYQQPQGQRQHRAKVCEVADIMKGRAVRLIDTLAQYDYDDRDSWAAGLEWLRNEVVLGEGAEAMIMQMAVEKRNANMDAQARRALS